MSRLPLLLALILTFAAVGLVPARAQTGTETAESQGVAPLYRGNAIAMHGEPKYGPDFEHFDYVNPDAPRGGNLRLGAIGSFDNLNAHIIRGTTPALLGYLTDGTLMRHSEDEPFTIYAYIAERVEMAADRSFIIFHLDPRARFSDGHPITADDVLFSFTTLVEAPEAAPFYRYFFRDIDSVEKLSERRVKFTFKPGVNRELPLIVGASLPILPQHYWEGRDFNAVTLEVPVTSGPYTIEEFETGRSITYRRVEDYWAAGIPSMVGYYNFETIEYQYFRDATVAREALKAGEYDYRQENQAKAWAVDYNVPAVQAGDLIRRAFEHERPQGMQGFVMNTRRPLFQDSRVRRALAYAFDFQWTNRTLFFGQYTRTESYFANSELASSGLPEGRELEILERFRGRVPEEIFTEVYSLPVYPGDGNIRFGLREAFRLLEEAGWVVRDMRLVNAETGQPFTFEFLTASQDFQRVLLPYVQNLRRLGIEANIRLVDTSQYVERVRRYDFDMITYVWGQSASPGNEQRIYWSSEVRDMVGAQNYAGVNDPVVDELIEMLIAAPSREELVYRTRALDRVLLWGNYVVPNWHLAADRRVYWDKFGYPEATTWRGSPFFTWWVDPEKAARFRGRLRSETGRAASGRESRDE